MFDKIAILDKNISQIAKNIENEGMTKVMTIITNLGGAETVIAVVVAILLWILIYVKKTYTNKSPAFMRNVALANFVLVVSSMLLVLSLSGLIKVITKRKRPEQSIYSEQISGYSFPSMHTSMVSAYCAVIAYYIMLSKFNISFKIIAVAVLIIISVLVGISRMYLRVHYLSDTVIGFVLGWGVTLLFLNIFDSKLLLLFNVLK